MMVKQFRLFLQQLSVGVFVGLGVSACDVSHSEPVKQQNQTQTSQPANIERKDAIAYNPSEQGMALTQVAGQATMPYVQQIQTRQPTKANLIYAGRYHARIPCSDPFAGCVNNEKEAEYIINLLDDGSVYWTNTSFGRIGSEPSSRNVTKIEQVCKQVQWYAKPALQEILIRCDAVDVNLYYKINQQHNLVLNLDKIWNADEGRNRRFFQEYPFPKHAYEFEKIQ